MGGSECSTSVVLHVYRISSICGLGGAFGPRGSGPVGTFSGRAFHQDYGTSTFIYTAK